MQSNKISPSEVILHEARSDEADEAYRLTNDDIVRANSFSTEKIPLATHYAWYEKITKDPNSLLLHANIDSEFSGQVKFNIQNSEALIGISIMPEFRGRGLGVILLNKGIQFFHNKKPHIKRIVALIKKKNTASIKIFEKAGFVFSEDTIEKGRPSKKYLFYII